MSRQSRTAVTKSNNCSQQPLESADRDRPGPLPLTSLTVAHDKLFAGSLSRGVLAIENGTATEMQARPAAYFVRALETDARRQALGGTREQERTNRRLHSAANPSDLIDDEDAVTGTVIALQARTQ